jgi:hypothetical protein
MRQVALLLPTLLALHSITVRAEAADAELLRAKWNSQIIQNQRADGDDLSRMSNVSMVRRFADAGLLVRVPSKTKHYYTRYIPAKYSYLRPWSKLFLDRLSQQFYARFKKPLRITSMVRTVALQKSLAKRNGNAAAAHGSRRSSHLTGATFDISKNGMTRSQIDWMRRVLHSIKQKGYLYAVEEFNQPTFHIMVYKNYPEYVASLEGGQSNQQRSD